jgi:hypothetical protein
MSKPKTQAQLDKATDQRLKKTYGVGLDWYEKTLKEQGGGCAICHRPPGTRRLHVDHDQSAKKVKIKTFKANGMWEAEATYNGKTLVARYRNKREAVQGVKNRLKVESVRGLLCYSHNAGLQKFQDNPEYLKAAAEYLYHHVPEPTMEYCDNCDGCGWVEGGVCLQNTCLKCNGTGVTKKEVA